MKENSTMRLNMSLSLFAACVSLSCSSPGTTANEAVTKTVGTAGGSLEITGATLSIPAGALAADTEITVVKTSTAAPLGYTAQSPLYELKPPGLTFVSAASVTLDFTGASTGLAVFITASGGSGYERLTGMVSGQKVSASILHFSDVFAGASEQTSVGGLALDDWDDAMLDITCHNGFACGTYTSEAACKAFVGNTFKFDLSNLKKAVAGGRLTYDAPAAKSCREAVLASAACRPGDQLRAEMAATIAACDSMLGGAVSVGGDCYLNEECQDGFCSASAAACPGKCVAFKLEGETVAAGDRCQLPLYVYDGKCKAVTPTGMSCAAVMPATSALRCESTAFCHAETKLCTAKKTATSACLSGSECQQNLICDSQGTHTCMAPPVLAEACFPVKGVACVSELACTSPTSMTAGTCVAKRAVGESCFNQADCEFGNYCTGVSPEAGTCQPKKDAGLACAYTSDCKLTDFCSAKVCSARKANGAPCMLREECLSLSCVSTQCVAYSCDAP